MFNQNNQCSAFSQFNKCLSKQFYYCLVWNPVTSSSCNRLRNLRDRSLLQKAYDIFSQQGFLRISIGFASKLKDFVNCARCFLETKCPLAESKY